MIRAIVCLSLLGCSVVAPVGAAEPNTLLAELDSLALNPEAAVKVPRIKLAAGIARLTLEGTIVPAAPVGGRVTELVFFGEGRIELEPPDEIEAGQLDLFTGERSLDERFDSAVLVIGLDRAVDVLLGKPRTTLTDAERQRATAAFATWKKAPERDLLNLRGQLWADALGEPHTQALFVGRFHGLELGDFLYVVDPLADEQVTLGRFVPLDATEKEKRRIMRQVEREQRRGRLLGVERDDLGQWDTWLSASLRGKDGQPAPGGAAFEPVRYTLDVTVDDDLRTIRGKARIEVEPRLPGARTAELHLPTDFAVDAVRGTGGEALPFSRTGSDLTVLLSAAIATGATTEIAVDYHGVAIQAVDKAFALITTDRWYPHVGELDRARYDLTFHWPRRYDLLASGRRVEGGEANGMKWERRVLDRDTWAATFEIGKFSIEERQVGHVKVALAFDTVGRELSRDGRREIGDTVAESLTYFEETFGPYPLDELTVVTVPRGFSQSMFGFVTLSDLMMFDTSLLTLLLGLEDRRTIIAHELAHQWWGHQVGWASYRDTWLSESMANYAALLYQRAKLEPAAKAKGKERSETARAVFRGPTAGWAVALTSEDAEGRAVESIGPLVLGWRLVSSRSSDAYQPIVYKKGAVVLDMLARGLGAENFPKISKEIVRFVAGRAITTRQFFELVEKIASVHLDPFVRRFIEGTGLPEYYYRYEVAAAPDGKWQVTGKARLTKPYHFRYRAVASGGVLDVARTRFDEIDTADDLTVVAPVQFSFFDPARDEPKKKPKKGERPEPNAVAKGHMTLVGEETVLSIPSDFEPRRFWLDRDGEVYGRFFDESRWPKRMLYYQGNDRAASGDLDAAADLFARALAADPFGGEQEELPEKSEIDAERKLIDGRIQLALARLALDRGKDAEAAAAFEKARKALRSEWYGWVAEELRVVEARLDVRRGDYERAYKKLNKALLKREDVDSTEGYVLLAIAAGKTGHPEQLDKAKAAAKEGGADLAALEAPR